MNVSNILIIILLVFSFVTVEAQEIVVLNNKDIIQMANLGLSVDVIKTKLKVSNCDFNTSVSALDELKKANVPDSIVILMMESNCNAQAKDNSSEDSKKSEKIQEEKVPINLREYAESNLTNIEMFPEKFENKIVFFRAKLEDIRRIEENAFSIGLSTGSVGSENNYKYFPPIFGRSGINILAYGRTAEILAKNKAQNPCTFTGCFFGGLVSKIVNSTASVWIITLFDVDNYTSIPNASIIGRLRFSGYTSESEIQYLSKIGADINIKDKQGVTPLMYAAKAKNLEGITGLIKVKVNLNEIDNNKKTALIYAVEAEFEDGCKELIKAGADTTLKDNKGLTAIDYANTLKDKGIIKLFQKYSNKK